MNIEEFKQLLQDGKQEEAAEMLEEFLASSISPQEQGRALIAVASMYMEAENTLNQEYLRILKNAVVELSNLQKEHHTITDAIELAKTRKTLDEG